MLKINLLKAIIVLSQCFTILQGTNGIGYTINTVGRLGDCILGYVECRWLSYIHEFEFYYRPFNHSDKLVMHYAHKHFDDHTQQTEVEIQDASLISLDAQDTFFITDGGIEENDVGWSDAAFMKLIQSEVSPNNPLNLIQKPENHITVAVHVRRGGGFDMQLYQEDTVVTAEWVAPLDWRERYIDRAYPTKFPPDSYYITLLKYIANLYPEKQIYAHIFTDDPSPELIVAKYTEAVDNPNMVFGYRNDKNTHDSNVLEDFFSMMTFDWLIRPDSWYSDMAGKIGRVKFEIKPNHYRWEGKKLVIWEAEVITRNDTEEKFDTSYTEIPL